MENTTVLTVTSNDESDGDLPLPPISPPGERSFSELRLRTPPRLGDAGPLGLDAQLDLFRLKGELHVSNFQVKNRDDALGRVSRILAEKEALFAAERQKVELLSIQVMELQLRLEAGATGKLEKHLERVNKELKKAKAEASATKVLNESDGNIRVILETVKDRELDILSLREALHSTQGQLANAQQESKRLSKVNEDMQTDMKSLLERRTQIQSLKSELLKLKHPLSLASS
jgi:chromosome segregation ATPase